MKWWQRLWLVMGLGVVFPVGQMRAAEDSVKGYLFYGDGCPHCARMIEYLSGFEVKNPELAEFVLIEVYNHPGNAKLFGQVVRQWGREEVGVPFLLVGERATVGFSSGVSEGVIEGMLADCQENGCKDVLGGVVGEGTVGVEVLKEVEVEEEASEQMEEGEVAGLVISMPLVGRVDIASLSLVSVSVVLGLLDGFNPCAMWVLVFLIGLLLNMEDRKRRWILGLTFIGASGLVYLLFMTAWLQFFLFVGMIFWVRLAVAVVAVGSGLMHLKKFWEHQTQCELIPAERRKKVFGRLEKITQDQRLVMALVGMVLLAFSVNLIELFCSAGLPAVFTNVLSMSNLAWWQYAFYMGVYILMFMLDDLVVFGVAMKTLETVGVNFKYTHWSNLVGGVVILGLGLVLLLRPGWLMMG